MGNYAHESNDYQIVITTAQPGAMSSRGRRIDTPAHNFAEDLWTHSRRYVEEVVVTAQRRNNQPEAVPVTVGPEPLLTERIEVLRGLQGTIYGHRVVNGLNCALIEHKQGWPFRQRSQQSVRWSSHRTSGQANRPHP